MSLTRRAIILSVALLAFFVTYKALTSFTSYSHVWKQVNAGMSRETINTILKPADWQKDNGAYLLERKSWLRLWRIDVYLENNTVTDTRHY